MLFSKQQQNMQLKSPLICNLISHGTLLFLISFNNETNDKTVSITQYIRTFALLILVLHDLVWRYIREHSNHVGNPRKDVNKLGGLVASTSHLPSVFCSSLNKITLNAYLLT